MTDDERAAEVLGQCRERLDRGASVDPEEVIQAHPDLEATLRRRFRALHLLEHSFGPRVASDAAPAPISIVGRSLGPYRLVSVLGEGGMGTVYLATVEGRAAGLESGARVALKVVHPHLLQREGYFKRFLREAEIGRRLRHENVVRTLDADVVEQGSERIHFFVMEYVEGQTLRVLLDELERVPEVLCRHVGCEIAKALAAIHDAGAVHRDLKPENVLITKDYVVKVMDLGVARLADESMRLSQTGAFVGSVRYAAPEQFKGRGTGVDGRADLYSLGLTLYELATGRHPFADEDFHAVLRRQLSEVPRPAGEVNPQVSAFFEELLVQLLAKDREHRIASAADVVRILEEGERSSWWTSRAKELRSETKRTLRRIRIPRETAVVGRDAELSRLRDLYAQAKAGEGRVVLVEGEAGIGKSRIVDEFVGRLRSEGEEVSFLFGSYPPGGAATASGAFSTAYREHFGVEGLDDTLRPFLGSSPILVPAFAALLRGEGTPEGSEPLTKDSLQTCFVHATRALAAERTTIVLIDDLHFAPEEGRALFSSLALAVPGHRILLVGTTRPTRDDRWITGLERLGHLARLPLARLGAKDLVVLLRDALRSEHLAHELSGQIAVKSDGNPCFVFEILRGLKEGQFLTQLPDGTWMTTQVIRDIQIPSSVQELVQARVADLDEDDRNLLDVASCLGFEFDPLLVGDVLGLPKIPLLRRLGQIERAHRLVRAAGQRYVFDHHQVQEALYGGLSDLLRVEYHAAIATALGTRSGAVAKEPKDLDGALCVDLAEHFLKGAQGERALRYLDAALEHLEANYLRDAAVALVDRALAVPGLVAGEARFDHLLRKAHALEFLGHRESERRTLDKSLALAESDGRPSLRARALSALGWHLTCSARLADAQSLLSQAIGLAHEAGDPKGEASALWKLGIAFDDQGRFGDAQLHYERSLTLAREADDPATEATAAGCLGVMFGRLGRYAEAQSQHRRHLALARVLNDRQGESVALINLGRLHGLVGEFSAAKTALDAALALCRSMGALRGEGYALTGLGRIAREQDDLDGAERLLGESLALRRRIGDLAPTIETLVLLGVLAVHRGRAEEGRSRCIEAIELAQALGLESHSVIAACNLVLLEPGDAARVAESFAASEPQMTCDARAEARFLLWQATRAPVHLAEAKRLLDSSVAHAPPEWRVSMLANVRLNREIAAAARVAALGPPR